MSRDELLTKLAMELAEWPDNTDRLFYEGDRLIRVTDPRVFTTDCAFYQYEYLQRRDELINKPSWDDAPEWARGRAQDADGRWQWLEHPDDANPHRDGFWLASYKQGVAGLGTIPAGHDWRFTLERRPKCDSVPKHDVKIRFSIDVPDEAGPAQDPVAADFLRAGLKHMEDRASTYDKPAGERSMAATVSAFSAITGIEMTEEQGWLFMGVLKDVRSQQGDYRADNYEDRAAYAGLQGEAAAKERTR